jgi:hypothetical protein
MLFCNSYFTYYMITFAILNEGSVLDVCVCFVFFFRNCFVLRCLLVKLNINFCFDQSCFVAILHSHTLFIMSIISIICIIQLFAMT